MAAGKNDVIAHSHGSCMCSRREVLSGIGAAGVGIMLSGCESSARDVVGDVSEGSAIEVDLSDVAVGESLTKLWKGKPVFIRHRTPEEIEQAREIDLRVSELRDPELDEVRVLRPEWLVVVGICPHLGCVPKGQTAAEPRGQYEGWFCACHGTHYDTSGRLMEGPGPGNLVVPPYHFVSDTVLRIGDDGVEDNSASGDTERAPDRATDNSAGEVSLRSSGTGGSE